MRCLCVPCKDSHCESFTARLVLGASRGFLKPCRYLRVTSNPPVSAFFFLTWTLVLQTFCRALFSVASLKCRFVSFFVSYFEPREWQAKLLMTGLQ